MNQFRITSYAPNDAGKEVFFYIPDSMVNKFLVGDIVNLGWGTVMITSRSHSLNGTIINANASHKEFESIFNYSIGTTGSQIRKLSDWPDNPI